MQTRKMYGGQTRLPTDARRLPLLSRLLFRIRLPPVTYRPNAMHVHCVGCSTRRPAESAVPPVSERLKLISAGIDNRSENCFPEKHREITRRKLGMPCSGRVFRSISRFLGRLSGEPTVRVRRTAEQVTLKKTGRRGRFKSAPATRGVKSHPMRAMGRYRLAICAIRSAVRLE